ncbi:NnrS family protein [Hyphomicrobium sp. LHD-15]|uniref:NnrS family protein n=1 Tax=Hyphomicrobium sp. LHD-15 TaxID=3072142 RepID=UPI0028107BE3|nr:NnrS family protein [Hyphomicrobium sp. LHD-15]MDQ8698246.1 NnrS family protein [Hyphomicrobium sp. LHD-15]
MTSQIHNVPPPTFLSLGFRPFFLLGALFAAILIALWVPWFLGLIAVPSAFPPTAWHAHELLFGFMPAIIAGFLLTAVPNWTGRPPVAGWQLGALVALWLAGRLAVAVSSHLDPALTAALSICFPIVLAAVIGREILAAKNFRNLKIVAVLIGLATADAFFHYEIWQFGRPKFSHTLAVALVLILLMIIAGRILPFFTTNWLKQNRPGPLPQAFARFDIVAMLTSGTALLAWVFLPWMEQASPWVRPLAGSAMLAAAALNFLRQARWTPHRTFAEPLLAILHIAYLFVGLGFLLIGLSILGDNYEFATAGLHAWTSGAIGTMTLAIMTRVSRGHTGRALTAPAGTVVLYAAILIAAAARIGAGLFPERTSILLPISGLTWVVAFGGFAALYGSILMSPRVR